MDNEKAINRLLDVIEVLKDDLNDLNKELSQVNEVEGNVKEKINNLEEKIVSLEEELNKIENRLRQLEIQYSETKGINQNPDPKLQQLPSRQELEKKLSKKINFRTMIVVGLIISFFASVFGTGLTLFVMIYFG